VRRSSSKNIAAASNVSSFFDRERRGEERRGEERRGEKGRTCS
jgi:hypothetical protein